MDKRTNNIAEYVVWLIKQYHEIKQTYSANAYRVVDMETEKSGKVSLVIQVCGKHITFKMTPQEVLADDNLLEGFSKKDIRSITYLACSDKKPKSKIVLQEFCEKLNKIVFGIRHPGKTEILKKTANEISLDSSLIKDLTPEEAHMIGYTAADENSADQAEALKQLKKQQ
jgi:predicted AAA+ superfamily ATPase